MTYQPSLESTRQLKHRMKEERKHRTFRNRRVMKSAFLPECFHRAAPTPANGNQSLFALSAGGHNMGNYLEYGQPNRV